MTNLTMFRPCKVLMVLILFITCGCATYTPQPYPLTSKNVVPEFDVRQAIAIVNAQKSKSFKVPIGPDENIKGNLKKWTATAVEVLTTELKKHDMMISEDAPKVLKLAITKVHMFSGVRVWNTRCVVYLQAETGDGYMKAFEGNSFSLEGYREASPLAITKAVEAMLNDKTILAYLKS